MGESAGASSILHHLLSYGGGRYSDYGPAFQQAVLQSRALFPNVERSQTEASYQSVLEEANVKDFLELQKARTTDLIRENRKAMLRISVWSVYAWTCNRRYICAGHPRLAPETLFSFG
jgi:carboxylesterase type B